MSNEKRSTLFLMAILIMVIIGIVAVRRPSFDEPEESYMKEYVYSSDTVKQSINDELEIHLNVIELECEDFIWADMSRSWWSYFNFSIVNKSDKIQTIHLEDDYYNVKIYQNDTLLYDIHQGFPDYNESQTVTLVPRGYHLNEKWNGASEYIDYTGKLPYGSYDIVGVFYYNSTEYLLDGIKLEIRKIGPIWR